MHLGFGQAFFTGTPNFRVSKEAMKFGDVKVTPQLIGASSLSLGMHAVLVIMLMSTHEPIPKAAKSSTLVVTLQQADQIQNALPESKPMEVNSSNSTSHATFSAINELSKPRPARADEVSKANVPTQNQPPQVAPSDFSNAAEYRRTLGLDSPPIPLQEIQPIYPPDANQAGTVTLKLYINIQGGVDHVTVVRSYPAGLFEESAINAFNAAKFSPGTFLGVPVKTQMTIEVEFSRYNRGTSVSPK